MIDEMQERQKAIFSRLAVKNIQYYVVECRRQPALNFTCSNESCFEIFMCWKLRVLEFRQLLDLKGSTQYLFLSVGFKINGHSC